ncbi:hypothetical protein [Mycoplasmopsis primatum]|uniref:hypothetical protein n=1 Tax=Mycoplasmopsis primatum TaxID=55604 RepID=UPI0004968EFD|nr:hypothetical protein [Mycoplasmopsis primatum]
MSFIDSFYKKINDAVSDFKKNFSPDHWDKIERIKTDFKDEIVGVLRDVEKDEQKQKSKKSLKM